jgi:hypothetical protein
MEYKKRVPNGSETLLFKAAMWIISDNERR